MILLFTIIRLRYENLSEMGGFFIFNIYSKIMYKNYEYRFSIISTTKDLSGLFKDIYDNQQNKKSKEYQN